MLHFYFNCWFTFLKFTFSLFDAFIINILVLLLIRTLKMRIYWFFSWILFNLNLTIFISYQFGGNIDYIKNIIGLILLVAIWFPLLNGWLLIFRVGSLSLFNKIINRVLIRIWKPINRVLIMIQSRSWKWI